MYNNIKMRLTPFTVVVTSMALVVGLMLLFLGANPASAFRLSEEEGKGHFESQRSPNNIIFLNSNHNNLNDASNLRSNGVNSSSSTNNKKGSLSPKSSLSSSSTSQSNLATASASSSSSKGIVLSKRSFSSSASNEPSSFRSHRHENSILNVAWPPNAMWGFLPSHKSAPPQTPLSLHSQSSNSNFNKRESSMFSTSSKGSPMGKKKSASSDLFLDPVTLDDERPSSFVNSHHHRASSSGIVDDSPIPRLFHTSSGSASSSSNPGTAIGNTNGGNGIPTPPPRSHYILLQPPTRIEPQLESDIGIAAALDEDLMENEIFNGGDESGRNLQNGDHASWLKRSHSPSSGIITRSSSDTNKRTLKYDIPQIECPPADDGMERFACPSADRLGRYRCVDDHVLCDGFIDCPGKEDEDLQACMFYKTTKAHLDVLADALLRWARGKR